MTLAVRVDRGRCRGAGSCVLRAPASFELDAEGRATVREQPGDSDTQLRDAALACPFFAIELVESVD